MKKIALFAVAIAIGFAGLAQTAPTKKDDKAAVKNEKKAAGKSDAKKATVKTDAKKTDVKAK